jgi:hypothetical protein
MSEIRESLNSQAEDASIEDREKLLNEYQESERHYRAELQIEGLANDAPEHPERRELRTRASVTDYLKEAVSGHAVTGCRGKRCTFPALEAFVSDTVGKSRIVGQLVQAGINIEAALAKAEFDLNQ